MSTRSWRGSWRFIPSGSTFRSTACGACSKRSTIRSSKLPPVIHVAGTNGKGSAIAFMRAMLEAAGARVHVYTSPNLVRMNERYRLGRAGGGVLVGDAELAEALAVCERANGDAPITVFEIETAAGFLMFSRHPADALLLEVGLGGRLDATNVVAVPLASVITPVSMDHVDFLGDTLEKIAGEKAAIFKRGMPAVVGRQTEGPLSVIVERAERDRRAAPCRRPGLGRERGARPARLPGRAGPARPAGPRLFGRHQIDNAGTAIAALRAAGFKLPQAAYDTGLVRAEWPARMQRLAPATSSPMRRRAAKSGSTAATIRTAAASSRGALADLEERVSRPSCIVVGMLASKDQEGFLRNFTGLARRLIAVPIRQEKGCRPRSSPQTARGIGIPAGACVISSSALARIAALDLDPPPRILITGSLYLAGEVLAANGTPPS